jgi:gliding motility-associated-like protein
VCLFHRFVGAVVLLCICCSNSPAQNKSNRGKEFWLGYGHNILFTQGSPPNSQTHVLYLSTEQAATVTVTVNGTAWSRTVNIPANTVDFSVIIPKTGPEDARLLSEGKSTKGIHIVSDVPIVAYAHQYGSVSSAATMLMPVETFGYSYYSLNYTQVSNTPDSYSWFYIVASENNTRIEITPSDSTQAGWLPNQTYTVNLNRGEIYNVFGKKTATYTGKDMTGSKIVSVAGADGNCHPVAVFSGSSRNVLCNGNGGDVLQQQIFPANTWGTRYLTYHAKVNAGEPVTTGFLNIYRIAVRNPSTVVKRNGTVLSGLINNSYYEFTSTTGDYIEADEPVLVAQFPVSSNQCSGTADPPVGDPEMIYVSPIEQGVKKAVFYHTRNQAIDVNYVNIIIKTAGLLSLRIDGAPVTAGEYASHPFNSAYTVVIKRLLGAAAQHTISSDSTFIASLFGSGFYESYAYNTGTLVNNLNAYSKIENNLRSTTAVDSFTCVDAPFTLTAQVAYKLNSMRWQLNQVTGLTPAVDTTIINPLPTDSILINGRKYYNYTFPRQLRFATAGTYSIPVTYTSPAIDACSNTEQTSLTVLVKPKPIADFTITGNTCISDTLHLRAVTGGNGFVFDRFSWTFADSSRSFATDTTKTFVTSGPQPVRLQIISLNGCIGDTTKNIIISDLPTAGFQLSTSSVCEGTAVTFTDTSSITTGSIATRQWNFGDGQTVSYRNNNPFTYTYRNAGIYNITLVATASTGCGSDTAYGRITVLQKPLASFSIVKDVCIGDSVRIVNSSNSTINNWNFGDGTNSTSTAASFYHRYTNPGTYNISLITEDVNGCRSLPLTVSTEVYALPNINAGADKSIIRGSSVLLDAAITNAAAYSFSWTPANTLTDANILQPVASPTVTTTYVVTATHLSAGCSNSDSVVVEVVAKLFVPTAFTPNGDGINDRWYIPGLQIYPDAEVMIYNRWGQEILRSKNYNNNPWNGEQNNRALPAGAYTYMIRLNNDRRELLRGVIHLVR